MSGEKELVNAFAAAWNEVAPEHFGGESALSLLALREVSGEQMNGALAVAATWSAAFAAECRGAAGGVLISLFKSEDCDEIERALKRDSDGAPKPGARFVLGAALAGAAARFAGQTSSEMSFGDPQFLDLASDESRLAQIVGDAAWVGTFSLTAGAKIETQTLLLYAPHGSLAPAAADPRRAAQTAPQAGAAPPAQAPAAPQPAPSRRPTTRREEPPPKNIERLLEVELGVVVRFGSTSAPLREVVRLGSGSMIELNRAVDEPVELLVNGRVLARGEVVVVDGYYGVRVTEIGPQSERSASLL
jgi:flagellar motor switch protein FliN